MAKILSYNQTERIKALRKKFKPYADKGWMCEGSEDSNGRPCNAIFNNDTEEFFLADYNGNIITKDTDKTLMEDLIAMAKIQGNIRHVCGL